MASPRSLTYALYQNWDAIERLVVLGREMPAFEPEQVIKAIEVCASTEREAAEDILRRMVSSELLQQLPRTTVFQINPAVLDFVRTLTREHELGLSDVLRARINGIKEATQSLTDSIANSDSDLRRQSVVQLTDLFRQISNQLDQDRHAILEIAERAKSRSASLPAAKRYAEALGAYDRYVEPMIEMMDASQSGPFYRHLEAAESTLDHVYERLTQRGALYSELLAIRHASFQVKELRRFGREVMTQCSNTLLPLREEWRQHSALSSAIVKLLSRVRKRGLKATLPDSELPLWRRDKPSRISVGEEVKTLMAAALHYQPSTVTFPEDLGGAESVMADQVDENAIVGVLRQELPVGDLLRWIAERQPEWRGKTTLGLYHRLLNREEWDVAYAGDETFITLREATVRYYPHGITPKDNA